MNEETATTGIRTGLKKSLKNIRSGRQSGSDRSIEERSLVFANARNLFPKIVTRWGLLILFIFFLTITSNGQIRPAPARGYNQRIRAYIDTIKIVDTHEHFLDPELIKNSSLLDFMLLLHNYNFDDFVSAGLNPELWKKLVGDSLSTGQKWNILKPYWDASSNTTYNRIALLAADRLFGVSDINGETVSQLTSKIKNAYQSDWFAQVINNKCHIESLILDGQTFKDDNVKMYSVKRFTTWLTVREKFTIDSIAVLQISEIRTLEDFVKSLESAFKRAVESGIVAVKINIAYSRPLSFDDVKAETARKVFRRIMDGDEEIKLSYSEAKPLQDYMLFRLLDLARKYKLPVAFHTGMMAGSRNNISYSDPALLTNLFQKYPDINFVLFHGSYPYGGELANIVKNFSNVYMDLSWIYAISPSYSERFLKEWIETVPAIKIMAFGGDFAACENTFGELIIAKQIIVKILTEKVRDRYFSEDEAMRVAKIILHDSAVRFYNLR